MESLQAQLLVSSPDLAEPFTRSVVLLVRHNEEGALGLILNRRTTASLKDAWDKLSAVPCHLNEPLYLGGPCEGPLVALHTHELLLEFEVMPGVYFCASKDKLESLVAQESDVPLKFFAGYSGWSAGQLETEIARGSWLVMPATCEHIFKYQDELWLRASRHLADTALRAALKIKESPSDPALN